MSISPVSFTSMQDETEQRHAILAAAKAVEARLQQVQVLRLWQKTGSGTDMGLQLIRDALPAQVCRIQSWQAIRSLDMSDQHEWRPLSLHHRLPPLWPTLQHRPLHRHSLPGTESQDGLCQGCEMPLTELSARRCIGHVLRPSPAPAALPRRQRDARTKVSEVMRCDQAFLFSSSSEQSLQAPACHLASLPEI